MYGKYIHKLIVYSFGDCNGRKYAFEGYRSIIDHIDMNHENNSVSNLQLVSKGINLFRAYYKTTSENCKKRFYDYYNNLDYIEKKITDTEIELDIAGKY